MSSQGTFNVFLTKIGKIHNTSCCMTEDVISRSLTTLYQMLSDRNHRHIQGCTTQAQAVQCMQDLEIVLRATSPTGHITDVYFHNEERVGVKQMRNWCENSDSTTIIIVSLDGPTSFTRKETESYDRQVQYFTFKELCVNITHHALVPKHEIVSPEECRTNPFLKHPKDLPRLYSNDKVSNYYNYKVGEIIKITRVIAYSEPCVYYRLVVNPAV